ncbi:MAG: NAD-dependent epimerase/dehydratase family protein, partial [Myxococcota bacterium]
MTLRALVAGAGYVGTALAERLVARRDAVTVLRRSDTPAPAGARGFRADLVAPGALRDLPESDVVFYLASADTRTDAAYRAAYATGVSRLVERLARQAVAPRLLLYVSSTAVYGQRDGEWVDETSPTEPLDFTGRRLLEGEAVVHAAPFPSAVLRLGGIYGPGRVSLLERVRSGAARSTGRFTNRIHRDDAAAALAHLAALPEAPPCTLGVDSAPVPDALVLAWLAERLGVPVPPAAEAPALGRSATNKRCSNARLLA